MSIELYKILNQGLQLVEKQDSACLGMEEQLKQAEHTRFIGRKRRLSLVQMGGVVGGDRRTHYDSESPSIAERDESLLRCD